MNIYGKVNEVRKLIDYIKKDKQVQNYKAVTHDQVTALVRTHLVNHGIVIYPNLVSTITLDTGEKTSKSTPIIRVEAVYEFTVVNIDDSNDFFKGSISAHANDTGDKAPGKALSYAKKAFILKLFEIETGEDEESRYETFNFEFYINLMNESTNLDELQESYLSARAEATKAKDSASLKAIAKHKDALKVKLS